MIAKQPMTLAGYVDEYELQRDLRVETVRQFRMAARMFERWHGGPVALDQLDERLVSEFLMDYQRRGFSPASVRSKRVQILALWRAAADDGLCRAPTRRIRRVNAPPVPVVCWRHDEIVKLLAACRGIPRRHSCGMRRCEWWDLAIRVAWDSGLRWEDQVKRLAVDHINADGWLAFPQSKTGRVVVRRLSDDTMALLRLSLQRCPRRLVTPFDGGHETFCKQFKLIVAKAGVRAGTWKWIRRAGATDAELQQPGAGSAHLGHAPGSAIAARHYLDQSILARESVSPRPLPGNPFAGGDNEKATA